MCVALGDFFSPFVQDRMIVHVISSLSRICPKGYYTAWLNSPVCSCSGMSIVHNFSIKPNSSRLLLRDRKNKKNIFFFFNDDGHFCSNAHCLTVTYKNRTDSRTKLALHKSTESSQWKHTSYDVWECHDVSDKRVSKWKFSATSLVLVVDLNYPHPDVGIVYTHKIMYRWMSGKNAARCSSNNCPAV